MITTREIEASFGHSMDLSVSVVGMVITVGAGPFRLSGVDYVLDDDVVDDLGVEAYQREVFGWLVEVIDSGEITVVSDVMGPGDEPYLFEGGPYRLIERLYRGIIPADATDLEQPAVDMTVFSIIQATPEEERRRP